jgi:hypothetical protein
MLPVHFEVCDIQSLFSEIHEFFSEYRQKINKRHIEFNISIHCDPLESIIMTDQVKLKQILINLINNAFKFTEKGKIEVGCEMDANNKLVFYVLDTGIGISKEKQAIIFSPFEQVDYSISQKYGGTGLGLSIVKGLLDLLKGKIWLESETGKGTKFYFSFPYQLASSDHIDKIQHFESAPLVANCTILIVEDDVFNAEYLKEILSGPFFTVIHTKFGLQALEIALKEEIDIVLMDMRLPDVEGYEITRQIKARKPELKIIAQTAYAAASDKQKAIDAGCDDYLSKPLKCDVLLERIKYHITRKKVV